MQGPPFKGLTLSPVAYLFQRKWEGGGALIQYLR